MDTTEIKQTAVPEEERKKPPRALMPRKKKKWIVRVVMLSVLTALAIFLLQNRSSAGSPALSSSYLPSTATRRGMVVTVSGTGTIQPIHSYRVTTLVKGEVLEAPFEKGQEVHKGDLLFRIDSKDVETSIQQAELALETARLNYDQLLKNKADAAKNATVKATAAGVVTKLYVNEGDMVAANAPIADILDRDNMKLKVPFHASAAAGFYVGQAATVTVDGTLETIPGTIDSIAATDSVGAGGTLVREVAILVRNPGVLSDTSAGAASVGTTACAASGTFSYGESKQVVAKISGELASLAVKEGDRVDRDQVLAAFGETDIETQIENAAIQVKNAALTLQNARNRLEDYAIISTIDGTVIEKNYDVGDNIDDISSANNTAYPAVIYDLSALTFDIKIDELDINKIAVGQKVEITSDALDGQSFTGKVDTVNINGTTNNGVTSYPVTVLLDGSPAELKPGMNVSAKIAVEDAGEVLCIPVDAVQRGNTVLVAGPGAADGTGKVVDPAALEEREVTLGRNDEAFIEVLSGLEEGDVIFTQSRGGDAMAMMMG